jgi:hypothetical protein
LAKGSLSTLFFVAAGKSLLSLGLIALLLHGSLPCEYRVLTEHKLQLIDFRPLWHALKSPIGFLIFLAFFATLGTSNFETIYSLHMVEKFDYLPHRIGLILTVVGGAGHQSSLLAAALGFIFFLFASSYLTLFLATGFFFFCCHLPASIDTFTGLPTCQYRAGRRAGAEQLLCKPGTLRWSAGCRSPFRLSYGISLPGWCGDFVGRTARQLGMAKAG